MVGASCMFPALKADDPRWALLWSPGSAECRHEHGLPSASSACLASDLSPSSCILLPGPLFLREQAKDLWLVTTAPPPSLTTIPGGLGAPPRLPLLQPHSPALPLGSDLTADQTWEETCVLLLTGCSCLGRSRSPSELCLPIQKVGGAALF